MVTWKALNPIEEGKAKEMLREEKDKHSENFQESSKGPTRDKVAKAVARKRKGGEGKKR